MSREVLFDATATRARSQEALIHVLINVACALIDEAEIAIIQKSFKDMGINNMLTFLSCLVSEIDNFVLVEGTSTTQVLSLATGEEIYHDNSQVLQVSSAAVYYRECPMDDHG